MEVVPLSDALGAELVDFDITKPHSPAEQAELRRLFCRHHLLLVRGQELTPDDHDRFVGAFGPLQANRIGDAAGYVTNREDEPQSLFGPEMHHLLWHMDGAYEAHPGIATSLWAVEVSPDATPTAFANAVDVVDRLPADLRAKVEEYRVMNARDTSFNRTYERIPVVEFVASDDPERYARYEHPVLFDPPHLDRKAIIANEFMTVNVVDVPPDVGDAFLAELYRYLYADDNVYVHHWQRMDVIIWDNIALHHARPTAVRNETRHLRRQCIDGWYTPDGALVEWKPVRPPVRAAQQM